MEEADGQPADWDDDGAWEESADGEPEIDPEWQAYYDAINSKPTWPIRILTWTFSSVIALVLAVTVMAQWGLWLALTMQVFNGWGGIVGGLMAAVQMWLLFGTAEKKTSCEL